MNRMFPAAHPERRDGKVYPRSLAADEIRLETRITTTADIFEAISAERGFAALRQALDRLPG